MRSETWNGYSNRGRGTVFQLMKMAFTNQHGKHKRMNTGMKVKQAAMGLQAEDPATHDSGELLALQRYSCQTCQALRTIS